LEKNRSKNMATHRRFLVAQGKEKSPRGYLRIFLKSDPSRDQDVDNSWGWQTTGNRMI
jgi:hypothetical protein